jgi:hypothetical protein
MLHQTPATITIPIAMGSQGVISQSTNVTKPDRSRQKRNQSVSNMGEV